MVPLSLQFDPTVGPRLRDAREKVKISQAELARRTGVREASIADWETGMASIPQSFQAVVAKALGVTVAWLMTGEAGEQPAATPEAEFTHHCADCGRGIHQVVYLDGDLELCIACSTRRRQSVPEPQAPSESPATEIQFTHHCQDCGRGMLEHGVCRVEELDLCFFCAKKRGHVVTGEAKAAPAVEEQPPEAQATETKSPARRGRPTRRTQPVMQVLSETGVTEVTEDFLPGPPPVSTQITATPPSVEFPLAPAADRPDEWGSEEPTPDPQPHKPTWQDLLSERRELDARKKAAVDAAEARIKEIDGVLWPLFTDEQPRLEIEGYLLTRVMPEPKVVVTWDVEKAIKDRDYLEPILKHYRQEAIKTTRPYLKATTSKGGSKP